MHWVNLSLPIPWSQPCDQRFLPEQEDRSGPIGMSIVALKISVSIMAGLAIFFPAMSAFNINLKWTKSLYCLAATLDNMPFSTIFYILFLLAFPLCDDASSVVMPSQRWKYHQPRQSQRAKWYDLGVLTCLWYPFGLSYGVMADVHIFGKTFLDFMDFLLQPPHAFRCFLLVLLQAIIFFKKTLVKWEELHLR